MHKPHPEAEVRLVVRFTVEEHIVYRGKVEKIHQLDSEELTRTVSRVVWTGHQDCEDPTSKKKVQDVQEKSLESITGEVQEIYPIEGPKICRSPIPSDCSDRPSSPIQQLVAETPLTSNLSSNSPSADALVAKPTSAISPNEEQASPSSSDACRTLKVCDTNQQQNQDQTHRQKQSQDHHQQMHLIHQPQLHHQQQLQPQQGEESATISSSPLNSTPNANNEIALSSLVTQIDIEPSLKAKLDSVFDPTAASPSILDALNDCVDKVDSESQVILDNEVVQVAIKDLVGQENENPTVLSTNIDNIKQQHQADVKDYIATDLDVTYLSQDSKVHSVPELSHEIIVEASPSKSIHTDDQRVAASIVVNQSSVTTKRKQSSDGQALKRVRRVDSKEQKSSRKRLKSTDSTENNTPGISLDRSAISNLNGEQFNRNSKIFAKWADNHFYPGTILKPAKDRKLVISFYDGAQRTVSETDLIPLSNITGKQVRVIIGRELCLNAMVHGQRTSVNDQPMFDVEYRSGKEHVRKCVSIKDIFLTGEQGTPLIIQPDRNSGASNFADVDLDNIIYEKRSRRLQELDDYEGTENLTGPGNKRKRSNHPTRHSSPKLRADDAQASDGSDHDVYQGRTNLNQDLRRDSAEGLETLKTNLIDPNSEVIENPNTTNSPKIPNSNDELGNKEFYFSNSSSPHRTNTSLLL